MKSIYSVHAQAFRSWLKHQRELRGLSMRDLGAKINKPHSFVGKVESGERRLDLIEFLWYCQALQADPCTGVQYVLDQTAHKPDDRATVKKNYPMLSIPLSIQARCQAYKDCPDFKPLLLKTPISDKS